MRNNYLSFVSDKLSLDFKSDFVADQSICGALDVPTFDAEQLFNSFDIRIDVAFTKEVTVQNIIVQDGSGAIPSGVSKLSDCSARLGSLRDLPLGERKEFDEDLMRFADFVHRAKTHNARMRTADAFIHYMFALDLLFGGDKDIAKNVSRRVGVIVSCGLDQAYEDIRDRLRKMYDQRSKYVHKGKEISAEPYATGIHAAEPECNERYSEFDGRRRSGATLSVALFGQTVPQSQPPILLEHETMSTEVLPLAQRIAQAAGSDLKLRAARVPGPSHDLDTPASVASHGHLSTSPVEPEMSFVEAASAEILKTLLSVFFLRRTLNGRQFSHEAIVHSAHRFALALEAEKTDDDSINHTAIQVAAGLLFAFYQNRPANKNWTAMVHRGKTRRFVREAYAIAEMMAQKINQAPAEAERNASDDTAEKPQQLEQSENKAPDRVGDQISDTSQ